MESVAAGIPSRVGTSIGLWEHIWRLASVLLIAAGCVAVLVPLNPTFPTSGLDEGWKVGINAAVAQGLVFGRDLIFTFGPYGAVYTLAYHPATDALALGASALIATAITAGLVCLTVERGRLAAVLLALFLSVVTLPDAIFFMVPLLFLTVLVRRGPRSRDGAVEPAVACTLVLLVLSLALLPLVKGTFGAGSVIGMGSGLLLLLLRRRWWIAGGLAVLFVLALPAFWLLAHQHLADLPIFFAGQKLVIAGYTQAMSLWGSYWPPGVFCIAALLLLCLHLPATWRRDRPEIILLGAAAVILLLGFKAGFVRQDAHAMIAAATIALVAWVLMLGQARREAMHGLAIGLVVWAAVDRDAKQLTPEVMVSRISNIYVGSARGLLERIRDPDSLRRGYDASLAGLRARYPLPKLSGPTDVYSTGQAIVIAHGLEWSPRPAMQSYSAYSPELADADARHLEGGAAPVNILFSPNPIDGRLPALEDGPSWPLLLTRYTATALLPDGMAVLHRRAGPIPAPVIGAPIASGLHRLGAEVKLPTGRGPLWARIDVRPTLLGRLAGMLFKPTPLLIVLRLSDGRTVAFRYIPGMGQAGFVLSPLVADAAQFLALAVPGRDVFGNEAVESFRIEAPGRGHLLWQRSFALDLHAMEVPPQPGLRSMMFAKLEPLGATAAPPPGRGGTTRCWLDSLDAPITDPGMTLHIAGPAQFSGWGFVMAPDGTDPNSMRLTFAGSDGRSYTAPLAILPRPDLGIYFRQPHLDRVGFQALLDLGALSGTYDLRLDLVAHGHSWSCALHPRIEVTSDPSYRNCG